MKGRSKEIRRILVGYLAFDGQDIIAGRTFVDHLVQGAYAGTFSARVFGLTVRKRQYRFSDVKLGDTEALCRIAFSRMGSSVRLETAPDAAAVMTIPWLFNPCIMTAEVKGKDVLLCFYTARTLFSFLNAIRGYRQWLKIMDGLTLKRVDVTIEPQDVIPQEQEITPQSGKDEKEPGQPKEN